MAPVAPAEADAADVAEYYARLAAGPGADESDEDEPVEATVLGKRDRSEGGEEPAVDLKRLRAASVSSEPAPEAATVVQVSGAPRTIVGELTSRSRWRSLSAGGGPCRRGRLRQSHGAGAEALGCSLMTSDRGRVSRLRRDRLIARVVVSVHLHRSSRRVLLLARSGERRRRRSLLVISEGFSTADACSLLLVCLFSRLYAASAPCRRCRTRRASASLALSPALSATRPVRAMPSIPCPPMPRLDLFCAALEFDFLSHRQTAEPGTRLSMAIGVRLRTVRRGRARSAHAAAGTGEILVDGVAHAGPADAEAAIVAAHEAFQTWRLTPPSERARLLRRAADIMREHAEERASLASQQISLIDVQSPFLTPTIPAIRSARCCPMPMSPRRAACVSAGTRPCLTASQDYFAGIIPTLQGNTVPCGESALRDRVDDSDARSFAQLHRARACRRRRTDHRVQPRASRPLGAPVLICAQPVMFAGSKLGPPLAAGCTVRRACSADADDAGCAESARASAAVVSPSCRAARRRLPARCAQLPARRSRGGPGPQHASSRREDHAHRFYPNWYRDTEGSSSNAQADVRCSRRVRADRADCSSSEAGRRQCYGRDADNAQARMRLSPTATRTSREWPMRRSGA